MANALKVEIAPGTVVRIKAAVVRKGLPASEREFVAEDGFGMSHFTSGQAIFGKWRVTGARGRIEGSMIEKIISVPTEAEGGAP